MSVAQIIEAIKQLPPSEHSLGALLMRSGKFADAELIYREDLARIPDNGWSLFGLAESLRALEKNPEEVATTNAKFKKIWAKADVGINSSCLCQPRT